MSRGREEEIVMIQNRNIVLYIILSIVTCGLFGWYWLFCLANDVNEASGRQQDTSGGMVVLFSIITCGIYHIFWMYKAGEKIDEARALRGWNSGNYAIIYLILTIFGLSLVAWALLQSELNRISDAN